MVKPKVDRVFDENGYRSRAACVCVRSKEEDEILLVNSSKFKDKWLIPGGGIEAGEEKEDSAVREVLEEAGVNGRLDRFLGWYQCDLKKQRTAVFVLFVMEEHEVWLEQKQFGRRRQWFSLVDALGLLEKYKPMQCLYVKDMIKTKPK